MEGFFTLYRADLSAPHPFPSIFPHINFQGPFASYSFPITSRFLMLPVKPFGVPVSERLPKGLPYPAWYELSFHDARQV